MRKEILAAVTSIDGLSVLEATDDVFWPSSDESLGVVRAWIHVCPKASRSIKTATALHREIVAKLKRRQLGGDVWVENLTVPRKKDGILRLGVSVVRANVGIRASEIKCVFDDPEITELKSRVDQFSISNARAHWQMEEKLMRTIILVVYPHSELYSTSGVDVSSYLELKNLKISVG